MRLNRSEVLLILAKVGTTMCKEVRDFYSLVTFENEAAVELKWYKNLRQSPELELWVTQVHQLEIEYFKVSSSIIYLFYMN